MLKFLHAEKMKIYHQVHITATSIEGLCALVASTIIGKHLSEKYVLYDFFLPISQSTIVWYDISDSFVPSRPSFFSHAGRNFLL